MDVRFAPPELERIDGLRCEALALPFFADERPLRGAAGLVDWRLCGFLSSLLRSGKLEGVAGETVLLPARPKLPVDKLFLFGLGPSEEFADDQVGPMIDHMLDTMAQAGIRTTALCLPGRSTGRCEAATAMEAFIASIATRLEHDELTLLEHPDAQRAMEPVVERERRRARAEMG
ncbi:MAG: hypothetical protein OXT09_06920 [Myxococcales bacterium]|nr:hypothetical protein [Myxococcales bacterium]